MIHDRTTVLDFHIVRAIHHDHDLTRQGNPAACQWFILACSGLYWYIKSTWTRVGTMLCFLHFPKAECLPLLRNSLKLVVCLLWFLLPCHDVLLVVWDFKKIPVPVLVHTSVYWYYRRDATVYSSICKYILHSCILSLALWYMQVWHRFHTSTSWYQYILVQPRKKSMGDRKLITNSMLSPLCHQAELLDAIHISLQATWPSEHTCLWPVHFFLTFDFFIKFPMYDCMLCCPE